MNSPFFYISQIVCLQNLEKFFETLKPFHNLRKCHLFSTLDFKLQSQIRRSTKRSLNLRIVYAIICVQGSSKQHRCLLREKSRHIIVESHHKIAARTICNLCTKSALSWSRPTTISINQNWQNLARFLNSTQCTRETIL